MGAILTGTSSVVGQSSQFTVNFDCGSDAEGQQLKAILLAADWNRILQTGGLNLLTYASPGTTNKASVQQTKELLFKVRCPDCMKEVEVEGKFVRKVQDERDDTTIWLLPCHCAVRKARLKGRLPRL